MRMFLPHRSPVPTTASHPFQSRGTARRPRRKQMSLGQTALAMMLSLPMLAGCNENVRRIRVADYEDKVYAAWLGQCIGNIYGLPHEFKYNDEPRSEPIEGWTEKTLAKLAKIDGAFSDDDTDIEYVDLFCMEKYGPEPTYEQLTEFWKRCINRSIWVANRTARSLMDRGYLPPLTGRRGINNNWYQIDPQLVCEIWAVTAPGMLDYAGAKADWAAKITNDAYGTHPTIWYNTMYAAAFFESDVEKLCQIGYDHLPMDSIFRMAIDDVRQWKAECGDDWIAVRKKIKDKYHDRKGLPAGIATGKVSALLNGALGVLALLYGQGDFEKTMNYACRAGYDADNQCATLAGLLAIIRGSKAIDRKYTHVLPNWTLPLNDTYKNWTRDDLPHGKITDMAKRTAKLGQQLVLAHGGRIEGSGNDAVLVIDTRAPFTPPLEIRLFPVELDRGKETVVRPEVIGGKPSALPSIMLFGNPPPGMSVQHRKGRIIIAGIPNLKGTYSMNATITDGKTTRATTLPLIVREQNLAKTASKVLAAVTKPTGKGSRNLDVLRDMMTVEHYDSFDGNTARNEDHYGYEWQQPIQASCVVYQTGPRFPNGGWFETLSIQYRDAKGNWLPVKNLKSDPPWTADRDRLAKRRFEFIFDSVTTTAIRIVGTPGGQAQFTSIAELSVHPQ